MLTVRNGEKITDFSMHSMPSHSRLSVPNGMVNSTGNWSLWPMVIPWPLASGVLMKSEHWNKSINLRASCCPSPSQLDVHGFLWCSSDFILITYHHHRQVQRKEAKLGGTRTISHQISINIRTIHLPTFLQCYFATQWDSLFPCPTGGLLLTLEARFQSPPQTSCPGMVEP